MKMNSEKILVKTTELAVFVLLVSAVWLQHGISSMSAVLFLLSLIGLLVIKNSAGRLEAEEKIIIGLFVLFPVCSLVSWYLSGTDEDGIRHLGRQLRFALVIPIYFWFRRINIDVRWFVLGAAIGSIVAMLVALYEVFYLGVPRARGAHHPIVFADIALIMGFMALAAKSIVAGSRFKYLPHLAVVCGIIASILSASRGAWIAIPALVVILFWLQWRSIRMSAKAAVIGVMLVLSVSFYLMPQTGVKQRIDVAVSDITLYYSGETINTSLGLRFEAWRSAFHIAKDNPVFGVGLGRFDDAAQQLIEQGTVRHGAANFAHTHNDYISQLATNGLVGLILLLAIYMYPAWVFVKKIKSPDRVVASAAVAGLCLVVAFMHYSLSETLLVRSTPVSFYSVLLMFLLCAVFKGERKQGW